MSLVAGTSLKIHLLLVASPNDVKRRQNVGSTSFHTPLGYWEIKLIIRGETTGMHKPKAGKKSPESK